MTNLTSDFVDVVLAAIEAEGGVSAVAALIRTRPQRLDALVARLKSGDEIPTGDLDLLDRLTMEMFSICTGHHSAGFGGPDPHRIGLRAA